MDPQHSTRASVDSQIGAAIPDTKLRLLSDADIVMKPLTPQVKLDWTERKARSRAQCAARREALDQYERYPVASRIRVCTTAAEWQRSVDCITGHLEARQDDQDE